MFGERARVDPPSVQLGGKTALAAELRMLSHYIADDWTQLEAETHSELLQRAARHIERLEDRAKGVR